MAKTPKNYDASSFDSQFKKTRAGIKDIESGLKKASTDPTVGVTAVSNFARDKAILVKMLK